MTHFSRRGLLGTAGSSTAALGVSSVAAGGPFSSQSVEPSSDHDPTVLSSFTASTERVRAGIDVADPTTAAGTSEVTDGTTVANATVEFFSFDGEILDNGRWRATSEIAFDVTNFIVGADPLGKLMTFLRDLDTDVQDLVAAEPAGEAALSDLLELVFEPSEITEEVEVFGAIIFGAIAEVDGFTMTTERDFEVEDLAAIVVSFIDRFNLDETQADAIFTLVSLYESAVGLLDNEFLYNPTIDNVSRLLTSVGAMILGIEPWNFEFEDFSRILAMGIENSLDTSNSTTLEALATKVETERPQIYDYLTTSIWLDLIPAHPQTGDWDPRTEESPRIGLDMASVTFAPSTDHTTTLHEILGDDETTLPTFDHPLEVHLTSGESGALSGSATVDESAGTAAATIVDNEFTLALRALDLASEVERIYDPVKLANYIEETADDTTDVDVEQNVRDVDIVSIVDAYNLERDIRNAIRDEPGRHVLEFDFSFTGLDTTADLTGGADQLPDQLPSGTGFPRDLDNDGRFEDTAGNRSFDIFDVQTLFLDNESQPASEYSWAYNFSGGDPSAVTVFDVQELFEMLRS